MRILFFVSLTFSFFYQGFADLNKEAEKYWEKQALELEWFSPWSQVLDWKPPHAKWFLDGKLNACYNCIDKHQGTDVWTKVAVFWEGEEGERRGWTYEELFREINCFSNVLKARGVQKGDVVLIYLPMIPEAIVSILSCARIGAVHNVVFAGFSADALRDRIVDSEAKLVITADHARRRGKMVPLKQTVDFALLGSSSVQGVIVVDHLGLEVQMAEPRDFWYQDLMKDAFSFCMPEPMDANDPLFILYTSGTTGKPKGIVHSTAGYLLGVNQSMASTVGPSDTLLSFADIGWLGGHNLVVYGPFLKGATQVMFEGAFDYPSKERIWQTIEQYKVSTLFAAPTVLRTFMKWGDTTSRKFDLSSLKKMLTGGERLTAEPWRWFVSNVCQGQCLLSNGWGQTETGTSIFSSLLSLSAQSKPGSVGVAYPWMEVKIIDEEGNECEEGDLVLTRPWPSMLQGVYKDEKRYEELYWRKFDEKYFYFTGDRARKDLEGDFWILGRSDDVINVSAHRISLGEIEAAMISHPAVAEAAFIDIPHEIKGQGILGFVVLKEKDEGSHPLEKELKEHLVERIGAFVRPEKIMIVADLPKTRSGKLMKSVLKNIIEGKMTRDLSTIADISVIEMIQNQCDRTFFPGSSVDFSPENRSI